MSIPRFALASLLVLAASACDNATSLGPLVPFSRPEHIAFACFAPLASDPTGETFDVVPQRCCSANVSREEAQASCGLQLTRNLLDPTREDLVADEYGKARLHALITQSTRGEVAAVDMTEGRDERVLDSDSLIPGYTFLDTGGLPSAVVMPPKQPRSSGPAVGAKYTFVASAEEHQLRALPACRFRSGRACGPELKFGPNEMLSDRLILPLPGAPGDMILGPDDALWVSLPELALLARVELADPAVSPDDAFALDPTTRLPKVPQFYRVANGPIAEPVAPVPELEAYAEVCGLKVPYQAQSVPLPIAPRASVPAEGIRPRQLRFDPTSNVLLVGDAAAPVIHAFALGADGTLSARGALPTGAPIRDFALTAPVPVQVPRQPDNAPAALATTALEALPSVRYLYAIDDRDGSVMVFTYAVDAGAVRLIPLLAPVPNGRFADRIDVPAPAAALEVIDTRGSSRLACGAPFDESRVVPAPDQTREDAVRDALAAYNTESPAVRTGSGASTLRGVFLTVAAQSGLISVVDIHDLDLACRAQKECVYTNDPAGTVPVRPDARAAVAVRRHAARLSATGNVAVTPSNLPLFAQTTCEDGYQQVFPPPGGAPQVCAPSDPWFLLADGWNLQYQPVIPGTVSTGGVLSVGPVGTEDQGDLVLTAPSGLDLCGRGVLPGDRVAVAETQNDTRTASDVCGTVGGEDADDLLEVREAFRNRLVLRPVGSDPAQRIARREQLIACYRDFVRFDVRAGSFMLLSSGRYLSNVIAGPNDTCIRDPLRERMTSRAVPGEQFVNPYLSFTLAPTAADDVTEVRSAAVPVTSGATPLTQNLVTGTFSDVLPSELRFYPGTNELYVVDSASQGLVRYSLNPFSREQN